MIVITGATGTVGSRVASQLAAAGHGFRALARDPSKASSALGPGAEVAVGDLARPETLDGALDGAKRLFLLSPNVPADERRELVTNAITAAKRAGVERIVYLSVAARGREPEQAYGRIHQDAERRIEESGCAWTHLRPIAFMSNLLYSLDSIKAENAFYLPTGDGKMSAIDPDDIAAVAAKALVEDGHEGKRFVLTGPQALSHADQAEQLSAVLGRNVSYVDVPEAAAREAMLEARMAPETAEDLLEFYALIKAGERALISPDFERVMSREPRTFATYIEQNAGVFK